MSLCRTSMAPLIFSDFYTWSRVHLPLKLLEVKHTADCFRSHKNVAPRLVYSELSYMWAVDLKKIPQEHRMRNIYSETGRQNGRTSVEWEALSEDPL